MEEEKQKETCVICIEEIEEAKKARINSCNRLFCYQCIHDWGTTAENSCPLCKKKFNSIFYKNVTGGESQVKIENKSNIPDGEEDICDNCYADVNTETERVLRCEICEESYLCQNCIRQLRLEQGQFICDFCTGIGQEDESSSDADGLNGENVVAEYFNTLRAIQEQRQQREQIQQNIGAYFQSESRGRQNQPSSSARGRSTQNQPLTNQRTNINHSISSHADLRAFLRGIEDMVTNGHARATSVGQTLRVEAEIQLIPVRSTSNQNSTNIRANPVPYSGFAVRGGARPQGRGRGRGNGTLLNLGGGQQNNRRQNQVTYVSRGSYNQRSGFRGQRR